MSPAPHPRMHGLTHRAGGPDPIPGLGGSGGEPVRWVDPAEGSAALPAAVTQVGSGGNAVISTTAVATTTAAVPADTVVAVLTANRNVNGVAVSCADSRGNTYVLTASGDYGSAGNFPATAIFTTVLTTALQIGDTVTVTYPGAGNSRKAVSVLRLDGVGASAVDQTANAQGQSATPSCGTTATTTEEEEIVLGAVGMVNAGKAYGGGSAMLPGAGYSPIGSPHSGGTSGTEIVVLGLYRITTVAGTQNPTLSGGSASDPWSGATVTYKVGAYPQGEFTQIIFGDGLVVTDEGGGVIRVDVV